VSLPKPRRSYHAETGTCIACNGEGPAHRVREGGPFMHQNCAAVVVRMATDPLAGDADFIARCDAAGSRDAALASMIMYVPSAYIEDAVMGLI